MPDALRKTVQEAVLEFERGDTEQATVEARCARDADKLECLIQAVEYREAGYQGVQEWIESRGRRCGRTPRGGSPMSR